MTDTFGPISQTPFAYYDPESACLRTSQGTFHWDSTPSSLTLPKWGSMRNGELCERPTPELLTAARGSSSSLIGTPTASLGTGGGRRSHTFDPDSTSRRHPNPRELIDLLPTPTSSMTTGAGSEGREGGLNLQTAAALLPTPRATDGEKGGPGQVNGRGVADSLPGIAPTLLPTPAVNDMGANKTVEQWDEWTDRMRDKHGNGNGHGKSLAIEAQRHTDFGPYTPAVNRWELLTGRPAPSPTRPDGKNGNPRLNPQFVEWMMGLPAGWVTDVDIPRNAQLKALGNGVVPQQAELALQLLDPR